MLHLSGILEQRSTLNAILHVHAYIMCLCYLPSHVCRVLVFLQAKARSSRPLPVREAIESPLDKCIDDMIKQRENLQKGLDEQDVAVFSHGKGKRGHDSL